MRRISAIASVVILVFLAMPLLAADGASVTETYFAPGQVDLLSLLPPPPQPGSSRALDDMQRVLQAQRLRNAAAIARARADVAISVFRFADVLGPNFTPENLPKLAALMERIRQSEVGPVNLVKDYWQRSRPFLASAQVHALAEAKEGVRNNDGRTYSFSYPSGHATFGATCAIILANMVPEKRREIFARGWEYGDNRMVGGVHFPSDIEAGRIDATVMVYAMMQSSDFQRDFAEAKAELRRVLGLSP